jgi:hypothetical protein
VAAPGAWFRSGGCFAVINRLRVSKSLADDALRIGPHYDGKIGQSRTKTTAQTLLRTTDEVGAANKMCRSIDENVRNDRWSTEELHLLSSFCVF